MIIITNKYGLNHNYNNMNAIELILHSEACMKVKKQNQKVNYKTLTMFKGRTDKKEHNQRLEPHNCHTGSSVITYIDPLASSLLFILTPLQ